MVRFSNGFLGRKRRLGHVAAIQRSQRLSLPSVTRWQLVHVRFMEQISVLQEAMQTVIA